MPLESDVPKKRFEFFPDKSTTGRSQSAPDDVAASRPPEPQTANPLDELQCEASPAEFDWLSIFTLEEASAAGAGGIDARISGSHQASPHVPASAMHVIRATPRVDSMATDDLRAPFPQTEIALERLKSDANAIRLDLSHLRDVGARLAEEYARLADACRQTEVRGEMSASALDTIETRLGPLQLVRDLSTDDRLASLSQLAEEVTAHAADFQAQKESIDHGLAEAARVTGLLTELEARVAKLTDRHELLGHAEETVGHLEQRAIEATALVEQRTAETTAAIERRAAESTADLERRVHEFEAQKYTIEHALVEAMRVTDLLSALDARVATLTGPDQVLGRAEETVGQLERRAEETVAHLEQRVVEATALVERRTVETTAQLERRAGEAAAHVAQRTAVTTADLERRTAEMTADLERRVHEFEAQKHTIEHALVEAMRVTDVMSALDARIATLTGPDQVLGRAAETVGQLERRAVEATMHVEQRTAETTADLERRAGEAAAHVAQRTAETTADLERRAGETVAHVEQRTAETTADLERRTAEMTADLERRAREFEAQKQTIEHALVEAMRVTDVMSALDARIATLTRTGQVLGRAEETVGHLERRAAEATVRLEQVARTKGELEQALANIQTQLQALTESARNNVEMLASQQRGEIHHLTPGSRSLSVPQSHASAGATLRQALTRQPVRLWAIVLGAVVVLALLGIVLRGSRDQSLQIARAASSAPALPSRTLGFASVSIPEDREDRTITIPTNESALAARPTKDRVRIPAVVGVAAGRSDRAPATNDTVQRFTGDLGVQSVPTEAAVFVDQQHVGETPLQMKGLRAGSHVIWIEHEGYQRWTAAVLVSADKETRVNAGLQPVRER